MNHDDTTLMKTRRRRGPSIELQRQIDEAIAARSSSNRGGVLYPKVKDANGEDKESDNALAANSSLQRTIHYISVAPPNTVNFNEPGIPPLGSHFEYLDHPADVILHSWGVDLSTSLSNLALSMFGYFTSLESLAINEAESSEHGQNITAQGHDVRSLVYSFLNEWLYNFHDSGFVAKEVWVTELDRDVWRVVSCGKGEIMDVRRHPQGTEVKAITYSGMKIEESDRRCDVYVVVDI